MNTYYYKLIFKTNQDTSYTKYYKRQAKSQDEALQIVKRLTQEVISRYKIGKIKKTKIIPLTKEEYYILTNKERIENMKDYYKITLHTPYNKVVPKTYFFYGTGDECDDMGANLLQKRTETDYFKCMNNYPDFEAFYQDCYYTIIKATQEEFYNKGENETMTPNTLEKEIAARLAAGETPEDIAASFSEALNKAETAANTKSAQTEDTQMLLNMIAKYVEKYYPDASFDGISAETTPEEAETVIKLLDKILTPPTKEEINQVESLFKILQSPIFNILF